MAQTPTYRTPDGQPVEFDVVPERGSVVAAAERHPDTGELLPVYVTYPDGHDAPPIAYRHRLPGEPLLVGGAYSVAEMCRRLAARQAVRVRRVIVLDAAPDREAVPSSRQPAPPMPDGGEAVELAETTSELPPGRIPGALSSSAATRESECERVPVLGGNREGTRRAGSGRGYRNRGHALHVKLAIAGIKDHHAFARSVLGRDLVGEDGQPSFSGISAADFAAVLNALTDQRRSELGVAA